MAPGPIPHSHFKMQRASTQLSINHQPMRGNLNKNFGSSHDLKILPEVKTIEKKSLDKSRDFKKNRAAPPPPTALQSNQNINNRKKVSLNFNWHMCRNILTSCAQNDFWKKFIELKRFLFSRCHLRQQILPRQLITRQQKWKVKLRDYLAILL